MLKQKGDGLNFLKNPILTGFLIFINLALLTLIFTLIFFNPLLEWTLKPLAQINILRFLFPLLCALILLYISHQPLREFFNQHEGLIAALGIAITLVVLLWTQILMLNSQIQIAESSINEANNRNSELLKGLRDSLQQSKLPMTFFADFSALSYQEHWPYIVEHKTQDCMNTYADITIQLTELNNIMTFERSNLTSSLILTKEAAERILGVATTSLETIHTAVEKCQKGPIFK